MKQNQNAIITFVALSLAAPLVATAQEGADETDRATQNPIADQIKVQFQNYFTSATGPNRRTQYLQNMIPTVPFVVNENWNLIVRTDLPIINQPSPEGGAGSVFGIGDLNPTFYLSPRKPGVVRWGFGPAFTLPTASDKRLRSGKWSAGPAAVVLTIEGPWVVGTRINNQWSFVGDRSAMW